MPPSFGFPSIWVQLMGGLGNQMFQYAAGRALACRHGARLGLDLSWFGDMTGATPREYSLGVFPLCKNLSISNAAVGAAEPARGWRGLLSRWRLQPATPFRLAVINEAETRRAEAFASLPEHVLLSGYWQSEMYFRSIAEILVKEFTMPPLPSGHAQNLRCAIEQVDNAVAVHVRRGDYVNSERTRSVHGGCCTPAYYRTTIGLLCSRIVRPRLFVFSDEPGWVPGEVVDLPSQAGAPHHDMQLMTLCRHHIIANSSFSWWGAWLSRTDGIVCAPTRWFAEGPNDEPERCPADWIRV
jgi:hypothetical protein